MKAQKAAGQMIVGVCAGLLAAVLPGMHCPVCSAEETADTAAISVGTVIAEADGSFSVNVSLDRLPDTGLNAMDFAVAYDPAVLTVSDITLLYDTGADAAEAAVDPSLAGTVFQWEIAGGEIRIRWATALVNPDYWLKEEGAFFTISGTVNADAAPGTHCAMQLVPAGRDSETGSDLYQKEIIAGYLDEKGGVHSCRTELTDGHIWTLLDETGATRYGDINLDGVRSVADAVMMHRAVAEDLALGAAAYANADCEFDGVLTIADVTLMLRVLNGQTEAAVLGAH